MYEIAMQMEPSMSESRIIGRISANILPVYRDRLGCADDWDDVEDSVKRASSIARQPTVVKNDTALESSNTHKELNKMKEFEHLMKGRLHEEIKQRGKKIKSPTDKVKQLELIEFSRDGLKDENEKVTLYKNMAAEYRMEKITLQGQVDQAIKLLGEAESELTKHEESMDTSTNIKPNTKAIDELEEQLQVKDAEIDRLNKRKAANSPDILAQLMDDHLGRS
ncbi:hypothetical protein HDE_00663 [Halotydeus destructor]|nr:hypothetical protein HDE_00663 [Halotydeus destructor]